jgi:hypothetical protein
MRLNKQFIVLPTAVAMCAVWLYSSGVARAQDVGYNYVPGTNFSKYKSYKWVEIQGVKYPNQLLDTQIKQAIDSQLAMKGLTQTDADHADLYVTYQAAITQQLQWSTYGMGGGWYWGGMVTTTSSIINVGTLVLDIYDAAVKQLIWRGDATKTLNPSKDPQKNLQRLQKAMAKLLKNYPPPIK